MSWADASSHRPSPAFRNLDYEDEPDGFNTLAMSRTRLSVAV
jgi:hypothetical protein